MDNLIPRKVTITEGAEAPQFEGVWTIGEVLQIADSLSRWTQSLTVNTPLPSQPSEIKNKDK